MQGRTIWRLICGLLSGQPSCDHNKSRCCEGQLINDNNWLPIAWSTQVPKPVTIILLMTSSVPLPNVWGYSSGWGCTVSCVRLSIFSTSHYGEKKNIFDHYWHVDTDWPIIGYWRTIASPTWMCLVSIHSAEGGLWWEHWKISSN